jgi:methionine-rich copper-binding protein CopC
MARVGFSRLLLFLLLFTAASLARPVLAHSQTIKSTPMDGAVLEEAPEQIELQFDSAMRVISVMLTSDAGETFAVSPQGGRDASSQLIVDVPALPPADYHLEWRGLSADGHSMAGGMTFTLAND